MAEKPKQLVTLPRLLRNLWESMGADQAASRDAIVRAVPILFPISITAWRIRQRVTTRIGLVERHVLNALKQFGPSAPEGIDAFMGLGVSRMQQILEDLVLLGAPVTVAQGIYAYCGPVVAAEDHFTTEVEQDAEFVLNGISGSPLPIRFMEQHRDVRIDLRPGASAMSEDSAILRLAPVLPHASAEIIPPESGCDPGRSLGFPEGFSGFVGDKPVRESRSWVIAFALLDNQGRWDVWTTGQPPCRLQLPGEDNAEYFKQSAGTRTANRESVLWQSEWSSPVLTEAERALLFPESETVAARETAPGHLSVTLKAASEILCWRVLEETGQGEQKENNRLGWKLLRGWDWIPRPPFSLTRIQPGDAATASRLRLLQGSQDLKRHASEIPDRATIESWWDRWQRTTPSPICVPLQPVEALLAVARERTDGEFREWLDDFISQSHVANSSAKADPVEPAAIQPRPARLVVSSPGRAGHGEAILDLLQGATKTVDIVTPVINDERVLAALEDAVRRNVRVRLITSLQKRVGFPTAGFEGERDPSNEVNVLHRLAKMPVFLRCTRAHPHAKLMIADNATVVITSANLNGNSLGWGALPALEAGVVIANTELAAAGSALFDALWKGSPYRYTFRADAGGHSMDTFDIREEREEEIPFSLARQDVQGASLFLFLPHEQIAMYQPLATWVREARHSVLLSAMSLYDTQKVPALHSALLDALARKVSVTVCVRPTAEMNVRLEEWPDDSTRELLQQGMMLLEIPGLHAKGILVDDHKCGIFSGNINPYSLSAFSATCHLEIGLAGRAEHPWLFDFAGFLRSLVHLPLSPLGANPT